MKKHERILARIVTEYSLSDGLRDYTGAFLRVFGPPTGECLVCGYKIMIIDPSKHAIRDIGIWFCSVCCPVCDTDFRYRIRNQQLLRSREKKGDDDS